MKHYIVKESLSAYLDGELQQEKMQELEMHLKNCNSCQRELQEIRHGKSLTAYFQQPEWQDTERLWKNIQALNSLSGEKTTGPNIVTKRTDFLQRLLHPKPAFVIVVLAILFGANLFINIKRQTFQYQPARIDWTSKYVFDYGIYLDALIASEAPREFARRYESKKASYENAGSQIPFRLASLTRMPKTFELQEVRLLKNVCCRSVQFLFSKNSMPIAIFQQPKGHPFTFGRYPLETMQLNGRLCHRVKAGLWTALSWEDQDSRFVAIGQMNEADMASIMLAISPNMKRKIR